MPDWPGHPSYSLENQELPEGNLRKYAAREYKENVESFIPRGGLNQANLKLGMKSIHTADVRSVLNKCSTNPITASSNCWVGTAAYFLKFFYKAINLSESSYGNQVGDTIRCTDSITWHYALWLEWCLFPCAGGPDATWLEIPLLFVEKHFVTPSILGCVTLVNWIQTNYVLQEGSYSISNRFHLC